MQGKQQLRIPTNGADHIYVTVDGAEIDQWYVDTSREVVGRTRGNWLFGPRALFGPWRKTLRIAVKSTEAA